MCPCLSAFSCWWPWYIPCQEMGLKGKSFCMYRFGWLLLFPLCSLTLLAHSSTWIISLLSAEKCGGTGCKQIVTQCVLVCHVYELVCKKILFIHRVRSCCAEVSWRTYICALLLPLFTSAIQRKGHHISAVYVCSGYNGMLVVELRGLSNTIYKGL